jgi:hypothetical protein
MSRPSTLEVCPVGTSARHADLADLLDGAGTSWTVLQCGAERRLVRAHCDRSPAGWAWVVSRYLLGESSVVRALDRTRFEADADGFREVSLERSRNGPNLHAAPICLPRRIERDAWHRPFPDADARVRLAHAGEVDLVLEGRRARTVAVCLHAEEGGQARLQWMAQGIGEIAFGPPGEAFERWMVAHRAALGDVIFADVPAFLREVPLPELPYGAPPPARRSLW